MDTQKRIRELMEERRWTDYRLAKEANLSHSTVTNMFNRNNAPTLQLWKQYAGRLVLHWLSSLPRARSAIDRRATETLFKMEYLDR